MMLLRDKQNQWITRERACTHCKGEGPNNQSSPYPKMLSISESPQHPGGLSLSSYIGRLHEPTVCI